jgi:hypothetical protein
VQVQAVVGGDVGGQLVGHTAGRVEQVAATGIDQLVEVVAVPGGQLADTGISTSAASAAAMRWEPVSAWSP